LILIILILNSCKSNRREEKGNEARIGSKGSPKKVFMGLHEALATDTLAYHGMDMELL
jgi:hypothetical protein